MDALITNAQAMARDIQAVEDGIVSVYTQVKLAAKELVSSKAAALEEAEADQQLQQLKNEVRRLVERENQAKAWKHVLATLGQDRELQEAMQAALRQAGPNDNEDDGNDDDDDDDDGAVPDFEAHLAKRVAEQRGRSDVRVESHAMWKELMQIVDPSAGQNGDDELEIVSGEQDDRFVLRCPITQSIFVEPVKNRECGHTYSKAGIAQSLRNRHDVPCPVPGCSRRVTKNSLVPDKEKEILVKRHHRQMQQTAAGGGGPGMTQDHDAEEIAD